MKKFILDTSGQKIGLGFFNGEIVIYENYFKIDRNYNSVLMDIIKEALKKNDLDLKDFDLFATTLGPGSFTGVRVGLSFIKAFAYIYGRKVYGMSTLDIMKASINTEHKVYPALDAKRKEVYTIDYERNSFIYKIMDIENYIYNLKKNNAIAVLLNDDNNLVETLKKSSKIKMFILEKIDLKIMNMVIEKNKAEIKNIYDLMPVYIRESDAETNLKRKNIYGKI